MIRDAVPPMLTYFKIYTSFEQKLSKEEYDMCLKNETIFNEILRTYPDKMSTGEWEFIKMKMTYEEKEDAIADSKVYP